MPFALRFMVFLRCSFRFAPEFSPSGAVFSRDDILPKSLFGENGLDNVYVYRTCSCSRDKVIFDENRHTRMPVALDTHAWQIHNTSLPASKLEQNC
jgi:hypothetical protein